MVGASVSGVVAVAVAGGVLGGWGAAVKVWRALRRRQRRHREGVAAGDGTVMKVVVVVVVVASSRVAAALGRCVGGGCEERRPSRWQGR